MGSSKYNLSAGRWSWRAYEEEEKEKEEGGCCCGVSPPEQGRDGEREDACKEGGKCNTSQVTFYRGFGKSSGSQLCFPGSPERTWGRGRGADTDTLLIGAMGGGSATSECLLTMSMWEIHNREIFPATTAERY